MDLDALIAREAIRATMAKYTLAGDRLKADDFAACFTEAGIIESTSATGEMLFRYEGRAAIYAWQSRWRCREPAQGPVHQASFVRHHLSTCHIDLTGAESATVRSYWVAWTDIGADHAGIYWDDFQKVGADWLIAMRRVRLDWQAANSLFVSAIENSSPA